MKRLSSFSLWLLFVFVLVFSRSDIPVIAQAGCGLQTATSPLAFCDNFTAPAGIGNRSGDLNGNIWGVSRISGNTVIGSQNNAWVPTELVGCTGTTTVLPPQDIKICNGQLREASNDNPSGAWEAGSVTALAMYPKQPFDWAGRTGTVGFDVGNDTHGSHAAWPEFWITDKPIPAPWAHFSTLKSLPQYGFGLRFAGFRDQSGQEATCPQGQGYIGVNSAILINNWVSVDNEDQGGVTLKGFNCVKQPTTVGQLNHFEVRVSINQIDVYGTDAGTTTPLRHLAVIQNANLGFTRGLIWIEDAHYNADKADEGNHALTQRQHTFIWDNVAFDGPFTYRDMSYDALDNTTMNGDGTMNLGKVSQPNQTALWSVLGMPANPSAAAVRVLFNFYHQTPPSTLNFTVNGHAHSTPWPYPDSLGWTWRSIALTIPISDLLPGVNLVALGGDQVMLTGNVGIVLVDVGGSGGFIMPPQNLRLLP